jgi:primosomal protein N' (replication factor Y) (superfamily II helicase)
VSETPAEPHLPVARVAVDISLPHLDRPFDYRVRAADDEAAVPGARVRVRFAGKLRDGYVLERVAGTEHEGTLAALHKVVSAEPVLTPEIAALIRTVADHYASCFADVMRLAVPPRHAATERATRTAPVELDAPADPGPFAAYPSGPGYVEALAAGRSPRAFWQLIPSHDTSGDWATGFAIAARACAAAGRGAVLVVPDQRDLARLEQACLEVLGTAGFAVLRAEAGPAARYRAYLRALRRDVRVVIGNRATAFAPVGELGLVALFDDGDDLLAEQRAPYPHARTVLALRAAATGAAALFAGYGRTAEVEQLISRQWLRELAVDRRTLRHTAPHLAIAADTDAALERDPHARAARLPHQVFQQIRAGLAQGPVLIQVPRSGYQLALICQDCREPARCTHCGGPLHRPAGRDDAVISCEWCGRPSASWTCPICGSARLRAPRVGATRTAEELGKAFPQTPVRSSTGGRVLDEVPDVPALVIATPGAEPPAVGGYASAVLLDSEVLLLRADLRAGEEALRRWLNVVALVRPGGAGGSVIAVGESSARALQALVRLDPAGFADRELGERSEARFPPAVKLVTVEGEATPLTEFTDLLRPPEPTEILGPVDVVGEDARQRLTLRAPLRSGRQLVRAVKDVTAIRSARKSDGALRIRVDPESVS